MTDNQAMQAYENACEVTLYNELASFLTEEQVQFVLKWKWSLYEALSRFNTASDAMNQLEAYTYTPPQGCTPSKEPA